MPPLFVIRQLLRISTTIGEEMLSHFNIEHKILEVLQYTDLIFWHLTRNIDKRGTLLHNDEYQ